MKTTSRLFIALTTMLLLFSNSVFSQDEAPKGPQYITVTTMHWNMDYEDFSMDEWKAVEKEYLDKVTMKNEFIIGASFFLHLYTTDNTELVYVQSYANWEDIDKAGDRNGELAEAAWPDDETRAAFFKKRGAYYSDYHSDEINATLPGAKILSEATTEDLVCYVRRSHFAFPENGSQKEFNELRIEAVENVIHKNEYIKAYYPSVHAWGSDRREFVEAFFVNSLADLEKMQDRSGELFEAHWPDEEARKERSEIMGKYFTGFHGDYIYTFVAGLSK